MLEANQINVSYTYYNLKLACYLNIVNVASS